VTADIALCFEPGEGIEGALVRWQSWSWAAHVGIALPRGMMLDALPGQGVALHARGRGVHRLYRVTLSDAGTEAACAWLARQLGKPYDWGGIVSFVTHRHWRSEKKWFCSELVASFAEKAGRPLIEAPDARRVTPADLLFSTRLHRMRVEEVYRYDTQPLPVWCDHFNLTRS
jgi:uncharacterized protein YycO